MVGERRRRGEAVAEAAVEGRRVRMSERVTEKWRANRHHRKPEGSAARMIRGGLVGPKGHPNGWSPMDNGLIFPYRRKTAHAEQGILTARSLPYHPCGVRVLVERGT